MTIKEAKKLEHFFCQTCTAENGKMAENSHEATAQSEEKVNACDAIAEHLMQFVSLFQNHNANGSCVK
jgi:protein-arginine kinase activator protein McsA